MAFHRKAVEVDEETLRQLFQEEGYEAAIAAGTIKGSLEYNVHLDPPPPSIEYCTRSQTLSYRDSTGRRVCEVHRYLRSNGTLAASGRPDPKEVLVGDVIYQLIGRE